MKRLNREQFVKWLIHIYIFYVILSSYSVYLVVFPIGTYFQIGMIILSVITLLCLIRKNIKKSLLLIPVIVSVVFTVLSLFSGTDTFSTFLIFLRFTLIFFCVSLINTRNINLFQIIFQCLYCLMVFYFCCYIIFDVLFPNFGLSYIRDYLVNADGVATYRLFENHFNVYIRWATNLQVGGITIKRMTGFCWEAGQYQIYLNFILMYLLFFDKNIRRKNFKVAFVIINIILCASSMGALIAVTLITIKLVLQKNKLLRYICFIPLLAMGVFAVIGIVNEKSTNNFYSFSHRTSELGLISNILFRNNIFGEENIKMNASNGLIRFLWAYGYVAIIAVIFIAVFLWKNKNRIKLKRQKIAFSLWLMMSLINEPIEYFNFTLLIISFIFVDAIEPNRDESAVLTEEIAL